MEAERRVEVGSHLLSVQITGIIAYCDVVQTLIKALDVFQCEHLEYFLCSLGPAFNSPLNMNFDLDHQYLLPLPHLPPNCV